MINGFIRQARFIYIPLIGTGLIYVKHLNLIYTSLSNAAAIRTCQVLTDPPMQVPKRR